jgi:BirA family biotin operon repressor/biotin-[acetyl-CoA-carboxylase] ligase
MAERSAACWREVCRDSDRSRRRPRACIGVNCVSHPKDTDFPATDLAAAGASISAESLFTVLSAKMLGRLAQWNRGEHFSTIRADWLARASGVGDMVRVRIADQELAGRFETVDNAGRLLIVLADGSRKTIAAGDVLAVRGGGPVSSGSNT